MKKVFSVWMAIVCAFVAAFCYQRAATQTGFMQIWFYALAIFYSGLCFWRINKSKEEK